MTFTQLPENNASIFAPLLYRFEGEGEPRTLMVEIRDAVLDRIIHRKALYHTTSGEIDIAPLLRHYLAPRINPSAVGFVEEPLQRWLRVEVTVEGVSETRTFLPLELPLRHPPILGSMPPRKRRIALGECDEITLVGRYSKVLLEVTTPEELLSEELEAPEVGDVPQIFRFDTTFFPEDAKAIRLTFFWDSLAICTLEYEVIAPEPHGLRLAWIDRRGALQHYTFPHREAYKEVQERKSAYQEGGGHIPLSTSYYRTLRLTSDYEPSAVREALLEIGTARFCWLITPGGKYLPVEPTLQPEEGFDLNDITPPSFLIRLTSKDLSLWNS